MEPGASVAGHGVKRKPPCADAPKAAYVQKAPVFPRKTKGPRSGYDGVAKPDSRDREREIRKVGRSCEICGLISRQSKPPRR